MQELMQYFIERGFKTFDFNIGDEPYKREWCDVEIKLYDHLGPATFAGWIAAIATKAYRVHLRLIKRNESIWPVIRRVRSWLGILRR
jgi:CelD/BcsL family acetyltransferase involved in cellulose biosynthesis